MKQKELESLKRLLKKYTEDYPSREAEKLLALLTEAAPSPRKAGRKPKYSEETLKTIRSLRKSGASIREIAKLTGCSVGYIQAHMNDRS